MLGEGSVRPPMYILAHHKCATVFIARYMRAYCSMNALTMFQTHLSGVRLLHPHDVVVMTNASYGSLFGEIEGGIHVIRNPLDLIVSAYYSHKATHPVDAWPELAVQRRVLCSVDRHDGMLLTLSFLEREDFFEGAEGPLRALRRWNFDDQRFANVRMEDLVRLPNEVLGPLLQAQRPDLTLPDAENHTFEAVTGRAPGVIDDGSHYRSGRPDQWRTELPQSVVEYVRAHFRPLLDRFYPEVLAS